MNPTAETSSKKAEKEEEALFRARQRESKLLREANSERHEGDSKDEFNLVYIIDNLWLDSWKDFIQGGPLPGPIANDNLLDPSTGEPKPDLKVAADYRGLNEKEWGVLYGAYKGGPVIIRKKNDIYSEKAEAPTFAEKAKQSWGRTKRSVSLSVSKTSGKVKARLGMASELKNAMTILSDVLMATGEGKLPVKALRQAEQNIPLRVIRDAKGLAFMTEVKAGFLFSAKGGTGIVIARKSDGGWTGPSCFGSGGVGAGLMFGASVTDTVIVLNTIEAVKVFAGKGQVKLGGDLEVAAGPIGRNAGGGARLGDGGAAACYSYSHCKGLYAGISIGGTVVVTRNDENASFYGKMVGAKEILLGEGEGELEVPDDDNLTKIYAALDLLDRRAGEEGGEEESAGSSPAPAAADPEPAVEEKTEEPIETVE